MRAEWDGDWDLAEGRVSGSNVLGVALHLFVCKILIEIYI